MTQFTCPNGHTITAGDHDNVVCERCSLIATHLNRRTGEAYSWTDREQYQEQCRQLQDQTDAAFDNQYFGDGW